MVEVEDMLHYRDKVLESIFPGDFIGWELPNGKIVLLHPFVAVYNSVDEIKRYPGQCLCLQTCWRDGKPDYEPPENMRPRAATKWWKFW
jgi:hypothetical protein